MSDTILAWCMDKRRATLAELNFLRNAAKAAPDIERRDIRQSLIAELEREIAEYDRIIGEHEKK